MEYVHISAKVKSRIDTIKQSGKAGQLMAQKATRIIEGYTSGTFRRYEDGIGRQTKYGEKRIKRCRKYDLGWGYRLIILYRGVKVYIPFLGTHDECQRWLENNSRLKEVAAGKGTVLRMPKREPLQNAPDAASAALEADTADDLQLQLSDQDLRHVFSGLVEGARKQPT